MDLWPTFFHRVWTADSSTGRPTSCPPPAHRQAVVVPSNPQLLHTAVHCSATRHPPSPGRVKAVTPRWSVGLWGTWVKLGMALGRSTCLLCIGCAELPAVHSTARLSTAATHRGGGQKIRVDLRKSGCPRFPQPLLLRPRISTGELVRKRGLCTSWLPGVRPRPSRLDPEPHRLSVACVRLVSGNPADDEGQQGEEPATAGGGFR